MKISYFINFQVSLLTADLKKMEASNPEKLRILFALQMAAASHDIYLDATKTYGGFFKSFIPGTKQYKARIECAEALNLTKTMLKESCPIFKQTIKNPVVQPPKKENRIKQPVQQLPFYSYGTVENNTYAVTPRLNYK